MLGGGSGTSLPAAIVIAMAPSRQMREFAIYWVSLALVVLIVGAQSLPGRGELIRHTLGRAPRPRRLLIPSILAAAAARVPGREVRDA